MPALPYIVAHRGASHASPENTLASLRLGWQEQADAAEIDIHLTADGHIVTIHDATLLRTAGLDAAVAHTPLDTILSLDAGSWKSRAYANERIPTLAQVLDAIPTGKKLLIEIKDARPALIPVLADTLQAGRVPMDDLLLAAFDADQLSRARTALPDATSLLLASPRGQDQTEASAALDAVIQQAVEAGFDGLDLCVDFPWDEAAVKRIHAAGLSCWIWTVNDEAQALHLAQCGVDGLTTDRPGDIRRHLVSSPSSTSQ